MSGVLLAEAARASFARHETFPLRFGWLRKAYTEAIANPLVFSEPNATVRLGVGKNMVNAIRYWAQAYKILEETPSERPRINALVPTEFGRALLADDGWDPWLERPASQWLLHWQLLRRPCLAPSWWAAYNLFTPEQFEEEQLVEHVIELVSAAGWDAVVEGSIKKDVDCLFRTFAIRRTGRQRMDDLLDCPARELGLLELAAGEHKAWRFVTGPKPTLPASIIGYACLDYLATHAPGENNISIARLTTDPGSPGRAFRLTESAVFAGLSEIAAGRPDLDLIEPGGLRQLVIRADAADMSTSLLADFYTPVPA
ncbi:DUF4007 family protein [Nocardioides sp.]|uniref:DUF4007 family protein n=1 Tax=Nocardioides sp. TaxID=35761 RepID=UPI002733211E|nr:DUF4007 family protein [Nocardioides sp.]MDP3893336.1 DUF4007 family protein [Nocardioides sp.]